MDLKKLIKIILKFYSLLVKKNFNFVCTHFFNVKK